MTIEHNWSRRRFVTTTTALAAGFAMGAAPVPPKKPKIVVGTQLSGWREHYERAGKNMADHLDEVLSAIRDGGYDYAETSLDLEIPENNTRFAEQLKAKGMAPVSLLMAGEFHLADKAKHNVNRYLAAAAVAKGAGFTTLNCTTAALGREKTAAELRTQVTTLREFGTGLNKLGLRLGLHHQASEMRSGGWEYHYNFRQTPSDAVFFCFDVDAINRAGVSPMEALKEYGSRIVSWHLRQSREGVWTEELGAGDIDYEVIARHAKKYRLAPFYTVELALEKDTKITRSVAENHRRSCEYVRATFGY